MSLADRLKDLLGKDDEPGEPDSREDPDDGDDEDEDDASVYPLW